MAISVKGWAVDYATTASSAYGLTTTPLNAAGVGVDSQASATTSIAALDEAIAGASAEVAKYGAYINRLEHASDNLLNVGLNTDASRSRIEDADYAAEATELARANNLASIDSHACSNQSVQANGVSITSIKVEV